jgi:hypothetical protein
MKSPCRICFVDRYLKKVMASDQQNGFAFKCVRIGLAHDQVMSTPFRHHHDIGPNLQPDGAQIFSARSSHYVPK